MGYLVGKEMIRSVVGGFVWLDSVLLNPC